MEAFIGTILPWAGTYAPEGWQFCWGQRMDISQYQALYAVIGAQYGGDGRTYFNLPDLRGKVMIGAGMNQSSTRVWNLGEAKFNNMQTTITNANMPPHNHTIASTVVPPSGGNTIPLSLDIGIPVNTENPNKTLVNVPENNNCTLAAGKTIAPQNTTVNMYTTNDPTTNATLKPFNVKKDINVPTPTVNSTCQVVGTGAPINIQPDSLCLNFIICLQGLFPPHP